MVEVMAMPTLPPTYDRLVPGLSRTLAENARIRQADEVALRSRQIPAVEERIPGHQLALQEFTVPLMTATAEQIESLKTQMECDFAQGTAAANVTLAGLASALESIEAQGEDALQATAKTRCEEETVKIAEKDQMLKRLWDPNMGTDDILALVCGRVPADIARMDGDQKIAAHKAEVEACIGNRAETSIQAAKDLPKQPAWLNGLASIKAASVSEPLRLCRDGADTKMSLGKAIADDYERVLAGAEKKREVLIAVKAQKREAAEDMQNQVRHHLERLMELDPVFRRTNLEKQLLDLALEEFDAGVTRIKNEKDAVSRALETMADSRALGLASIEELEKTFTVARISAAAQGVAHVRMAGRQEALNVCLSLELLKRVKNDNSKKRVSLVAQRDAVQPQQAVDRIQASWLVQKKKNLQKEVDDCDEEAGTLEALVASVKEGHSQLCALREIGLDLPMEELELEAKLKADSCYTDFPGLYGADDSATGLVAAPVNNGAGGQLAVPAQNEVLAQLQATVAHLQESLQRERNERAAAEARRAARRRARRESRASASSPRADSIAGSLASWNVPVGAPRSMGDAQDAGSDSSSSFVGVPEADA